MTGFDPVAFKALYPIFGRAPAPFHYLDNAATAQMPGPVLDAVIDHETSARANVKRSLHRLAERATDAFEHARARVAAYLGAQSDDIVFTSGTTAAVNLVAHGLAERLGPGDEIAVAPSEHHSNLVPWQVLARRSGATLRALPLDADGAVDAGALARAVGPRTRIVALAHISNVTGAYGPIGAAVAQARAAGSLVLLDGAQRAPHGPLDVPALDVDFYAFSGHKLGAPGGTGVLWARPGLLDGLPPFMTGGEMIRSVSFAATDYATGPRRFEAGTPAIAQVVGLGAACDLLAALDQAAVSAHLDTLVGRLMDGLAALGGNRIRLLGPPPGRPRGPLVSFAVAGVHPHDLCQIADRHGVALRGGHMCAQPLHGFFGLAGSTRASLMPYNTSEDVDACLRAVDDGLRRLLP